MIEKGLYSYKGNMPEFLVSPIRAFKWKRFFQVVTSIRPYVVKLFYKGYINDKQHYVMEKVEKADFRSDAINKLYGLESNEVGHAIFENPSEQDLE